MGDPLQIEVISRLERLEARMRVVESIAPPPSTALLPLSGAAATEVEKLVRRQSAELETLQGRLAKAESHITEAAEARNQLVLHGGGVPAKTESALEDQMENRMDDMRLQIEEDLAKLNRRTLTTIEQMVEDRVAARVEPIEKVVRNQAKVVDDLRERFNLLEGHLQRLVTTVERLVERTPGQGRAALPEPPAFRTYLDHAVSNDPMPAPPEVDPLFRPQIIKEEEGRGKRPRRPMTTLP